MAKRVLRKLATCQGNEPMAALIKEKDTCSNALVDLWCVIDFMEKVGFRKKTTGEKVRKKTVGKLGQRKLQKGCLEGFILLLFPVFWGTAKLTIGFQPWPKFTSSVAKNASFPLSTIFRSELEEMPLPFLLGQGFCVNDLTEFLLWPGYTPLPFPKNLKSSTWSNKNQTIKPVNHQITTKTRWNSAEKTRQISTSPSTSARWISMAPMWRCWWPRVACFEVPSVPPSSRQQRCGGVFGEGWDG